MTAKRFIRQQAPYLLPYLVLILLGLIVHLSWDKNALHLAMTHYGNETLDFIFTYITYLGDGWVTPFLFLPLAFINFRAFLMVMIALAFSGGVAQLMKHFIFEDALRPLEAIGPDQLRVVQGIELHSYNSFPSGHTTTAFCAGFSLAVLCKRNWLKTSALLISVLIGYSRVYLSQHFLEDVIAGSVIGVLSSMLIFILAYKLNWLSSE